MAEVPPKFPHIAPELLAAIIDFANDTADWLEEDAAEATAHGHDPTLHESTIAGWRFVAEAFAEQQV